MREAKIGIWNSTDRPRAVYVELWGEDYTLLPGEKLEIVAAGTTLPSFDVVEWSDSVQIYCNDTGDFRVMQNGSVLKCGHNRQPRPPSAPPSEVI